jgi:hypothetical protein
VVVPLWFIAAGVNRSRAWRACCSRLSTLPSFSLALALPARREIAA